MKWLKWLVISNGVVATESPPHMLKLGRLEIGFNSKPFRSYWPNGPSIQAYKYHSFLHHELKRFVCKVCGVGCWGYKQHEHCGSYSCWRRLNK